MEGISRFLTQELVKNEIIQETEAEIYNYGIELILSSGIITVCILILGLILGRFGQAVTFMILLANLRHYSGGYHANSYMECFIISCSAFILTIGINYLRAWCGLRYSLIFISLIATIYLIKVGSLNSKNNPKTEEEMCYRRKAVIFFTVLYTLVSGLIIIAIPSYLDIATIIIWIQVLAVLSMQTIKKSR